jgi:hypothetical protein
MRHAEFWIKMGDLFGHPYAESWAKDNTLQELDGLTPQQALESGLWQVKDIWRAVCEHQRVPKSQW